MPSAVTMMHENGLLGPDILLSHANQTSENELRYLESSGAHLSSTPLSEMQMGHGHPICLQPGFQQLSSLGTDSNSICTSYMPSQMEIVLQATRARRTEEQIRSGGWDATIGPKVEEVYNLGTILGAEAIGLGHEIGSLVVGKKADIVVFNGRSPAMISVAECNPVAGIVLHSSVRDVQTVIVDGVIRKDRYLLNPIYLPKGIGQTEGGAARDTNQLTWDDIALELDKSRRKLEKTRESVVDEEGARNGLIRSFLEAMSLAAKIE